LGSLSAHWGISEIPLIVIVGEKKNVDKLRSLELGADDCLVGPFSMAELAARVEALLRRATPQPSEGFPSVYLGVIQWSISVVAKCSFEASG